MWGSRDPSNILLEPNCSSHESCNDIPTYLPLSRPLYTDKHCLEGHGKWNLGYDPSARDIKRPCSTPNEFSRRQDSRLEGSPSINYERQHLEQYPQKENQASIIQAKRFDERFTKGVTSETHKHNPPQRGYCEQFRQGIAENVHGTSGRGTSLDGCSLQDIEQERCRNKENRYSREKPQGTPFSCNDCMEPQCLYCWRKLRDAKGDFSFLDGFESPEQKWKPGRKNVDQLNNFYTKPNQYSSRKSTLLEVGLEDRLHPENSNYNPNACQQSSCPPEEPQWKPTNSIPVNHEDLEPKEHHNTRCDPSSRENNAQVWPLGKGRGMGPIPGEWVPPFRKFSAEYPIPTLQRFKGSGATPKSDDWVPPFRGEEQPYHWHRCKGSGGCPPRDQWLPPWCNSIRNKQVDQVCGGRGTNSCVGNPQVCN